MGQTHSLKNSKKLQFKELQAMCDLDFVEFDKEPIVELSIDRNSDREIIKNKNKIESKT